MKIIPILIAALSLNACAHRQQPLGTAEDIQPAQFASYSDHRERSVRTAERVKRYPVGRYQESGDVMHDRHSVYRVEQDPNWNLGPAEEYDLPTDPVSTVIEPATADNPYLVDVQDQLGQLQSHIVASSQQIDGLHQELEAAKAEAARIKEENDKLKAELEQSRKDPEETEQKTSSVDQPLNAQRALLPVLGLILGTGHAFTVEAEPTPSSFHQLNQSERSEVAPNTQKPNVVTPDITAEQGALLPLIQHQSSSFEERMTRPFLDSGPSFSTPLSTVSF